MAESTAKCEISQEHLDCPICLRRFKDPKILDCLHSFCLHCLEDLVSKYQPDADTIICPVCRKTTDIQDSRCENLKSCFFLSSLVDDVNKREKAAHKRSGHTKKHRIVSDLQDVTVEDSHSRKCRRHPDQNLSLYCETCKIVICSVCVVTAHRSAEHALKAIADAVGSHRKDVDDVLKKFQKSENEFRVLQESISHSRRRLKLMVTKACDDVSAKEKEEIAKIQTKARLLRDEITKIGKDRDEEYEKVSNGNRVKMERAKTTVAAVRDLIEHADDFEMLDLKPTVIHNLKFQDELAFKHGEHRMSFIGVKCQDVVSDTIMGEILHEEKWALKNSYNVGSYASGAGVFSNGNIAVLNEDMKKVSVFTSNGRFKTFLNTEGSLRNPHAVVVTREDLVLVTDDDFVKVFNTDKQLVRQFRPAQNEPGELLRESKLTCIATDAQNRVAVFDLKRAVIYVTNLDGSLISVIPSSLRLSGIAFQHDDRLILSSFEASILVCLDFAGPGFASISTATHGQFTQPGGVCCDEAGDIYVTAVESGELHHYTAQGVHVQCIAQGLCTPWNITFFPRGELVVIDRNSVKSFHQLRKFHRV